MKHLIILVLAVLSLNQKVEAQVENLPQLPSQLYEYDREIESWTLVISIHTINSCTYCVHDMRSSSLIFKDTKTMKTLKEITGIYFEKLKTKSHPVHSGETDKEYQKIINTSSIYYGHHLVNWFLEKPDYKVIQKYSSVICSQWGYYIPEACEYLAIKTCQFIKTQNVKMRVLNDRNANTYTEFHGSESKVIREWKIPSDGVCSNNKLYSNEVLRNLFNPSPV